MANLNLVIGAKNLTGAAFTSFQNSLNQTNRGIANFRNQLSRVRSSIAEYGKEQARLGNEGVTSMGALNTSMLAVVGTIGLLSTAFSGLQNAASKAFDTQYNRINDISTLQQTLGTNLKESTKLTDQAIGRIEKYGVTLPVSIDEINRNYSTIIDDFTSGLKGRLANDQIINITADTAARLSIIQGSLNRSAQGAFASNISSILSGATGKGGIDQLAIGSNVQFRKNFIEELDRLGVQNLGEVSPLARVQAISRISEKTATDDQIKLLQGTANAKISGIQDTLFAANSGIFSLARNLGKDGEERKTVVDEFTNTLDKLFGDKGLFSQIGRLGWFKGDPIKPLYDAVVGVNRYLDGMNEYLAKLKSLSPAQAGSLVGKGIADITNAVFDGILGAISAIDWGGVAVGLASGIGSFFANLDWKVYLAGAVGLAVAAAVPTIIGAIVLYGGTILGVLAAGITAALGGLPILLVGAIAVGVIAIGKAIIDNWEGIKKTAGNVGNSLKSGFDWFMEGTGQAIKKSGDFMVGALQFLFGKKATEELFVIANENITMLQAFGASVGDFIVKSIRATGDWFNDIGEGINNVFKYLADGFKGLVDAVKSIIDSVIQPIQSSIAGLQSGISGFISNAQNTGGLLGAAQRTADSVASNIGSGLNSVANFFGFGARYMGNIPTAAGGLFDALATESARKPNSAGLVVANTSELILPQSQIAPFLGRNRAPITFGNINVSLNITGNTPIEIATQAISIIEERLTSELEASLA